MVEFKKDNETGVFNLMEINAKFWGSLDLALVCGANFPQMLIDDALRKEAIRFLKIARQRRFVRFGFSHRLGVPYPLVGMKKLNNN